jgi:hypothetical protein
LTISNKPFVISLPEMADAAPAARGGFKSGFGSGGGSRGGAGGEFPFSGF